MLNNDNDVDGDSLTVALVSGPSDGSLQLNANGSFSYTHDGGEDTSDQFTYRVSDQNGGFDTAIVTINVSPVNDAPVARNDTYGIGEGRTLNVDSPGVLSNDTDAEGQTLVVTLVTGVAHGLLQLNANGSFRYDHDGGETQSDQFTYRINDQNGGIDTATVTINITSENDNPVAVDDSYNTTEGQTLIVNAAGVLANDSDGDGDNLTASIVLQPSHGSLLLRANGSFEYSP